MRIAILTPLFPPDIGDPAPYTKFLASKLNEYEVSVYLYGHLPENIPGVKFVCTDKRLWLPLRIFLFFFKIFLVQHKYQKIIINNGPSTELPALLISFFSKNKMILIQSDPLVEPKGLYKAVHNILKNRVRSVDITHAAERYLPEILPFKEISEIEINNHKQWWKKHILELTK